MLITNRTKRLEMIKSLILHRLLLDHALLILIGDWDFYPMQNYSFWPTQIFFWSFIIIANMIMLNMILAVVFAVYDELTEDVEKHKGDKYDPHKISLLEYALRMWGDNEYLESCSETFFPYACGTAA